MNWFEDQIRLRKQNDDAQFARAAAEVRAAISRRAVGAEGDPTLQVKGALDEVLLSLGVAPRELPEGLRDFDESIEYACRPSGVMHRDVRLDDGWYRRAAAPMLGAMKTGETVALIPGRMGGYYYNDPATGKRTRVTARTQAQIAREAMVFYRPLPTTPVGIRDLIAFMRKCVTPVSPVMLAVSTLLMMLIGLLTPRITRMLFSTVIDVGRARILIAAAVFAASVALSKLVVMTLRTLMLNRINAEIEASVEAATMGRVLSLPARFFRDYSSGDLASRVSVVRELCDAIVSAALDTSLTSVFSLVYLGQVFMYARALVLPALIMTGATIFITVLSALVSVRVSRRRMEIDAKEYGMSYALYSGVQKLRLSGSEKRAFSRWMSLFAGLMRLRYSPPLLVLFNRTIVTGITLGGTAVMYFFAVRCRVSVADYYAFTAAYGVVSSAFLSMAGVAGTIASIKPMWDMVAPIMQAEPEIGDKRKQVTRLNGSIELNNVCFRYGENLPNVIDGLSLKIERGQYVAVVGRTGCGKSTLVRLLLGFEKPQRGAIFYDGQDLNTLDLRSVRRKIGSVTQNGKLFQGDIYSNIVISAPWLTVDDAWAAAKIAGVDQDIAAMPMGMYTLIGEGAGGFSGGQKQRLMIARAVAPKPRILILDEATSALDNLTQRHVCEALDALDCTRIVIAHRLSTIRRCDRIIVLDGGRIIEDGTYDELIAGGGFFAELVERQRLDS